MPTRHAFVHPDDVDTYPPGHEHAGKHTFAPNQRIVVYAEHNGPCGPECRLPPNVGTKAGRKAWMDTRRPLKPNEKPGTGKYRVERNGETVDHAEA